MEYKLPDLPIGRFEDCGLYRDKDGYSADQMRQYAEQAVAPLLAEIERLEDLLFERGEADSME